MQLVMFDIDGTLVDSNGFDVELYAQAIREVLGVEVDRTWQSYHHVTDSGVLTEVLDQHEISDEPAAMSVKNHFIELVSEYLNHSGNELAEIPGACDLVKRLQSNREFALAIATGGWRETAELKLAKIGINAQRIPLATSSEATARIDIMRLAEQRAGLGRQFARKTYFGDAPWDQKASVELGYSFVAVGAGVNHSVRFKDFTDQDAILSILGA